MGAAVVMLSSAERRELAGHEKEIERGKGYFLQVGHHLAAIKAKRLYRENYASFEAYLSGRWDFGQAYAFRLIDAAEVEDNLSPIGRKPKNERQARAVARLAPEAQRAAFEAVGEKPTSSRLEYLTAKALAGKTPEEQVEIIEAAEVEAIASAPSHALPKSPQQRHVERGEQRLRQARVEFDALGDEGDALVAVIDHALELSAQNYGGM